MKEKLKDKVFWSRTRFYKTHFILFYISYKEQHSGMDHIRMRKVKLLHQRSCVA